MKIIKHRQCTGEKNKNTSFSKTTLHTDLSAMESYDFPANSQAESQPLWLLGHDVARLMELFKYLFRVSGTAHTGIANFHHNLVFICDDSHLDFTLLSEFNGIGNIVFQHQFNQLAVHLDRHRLGWRCQSK